MFCSEQVIFGKICKIKYLEINIFIKYLIKKRRKPRTIYKKKRNNDVWKIFKKHLISQSFRRICKTNIR